MYLDPRLWAFTRGVRLRIAWTVLVGLVAVGVGISRLVLFGWLLARVIAGEPLRGARGAGRAHRRRHRAAGRARLLPEHGRPPHGGARADAAPAGALRPHRRARPRPLHAVAHGRRDPVDGRGHPAARGLLRPVHPAALRRGAHAHPHLRLRGVRGCADLARLPRRRPRHARRARRLASHGPGAEHGALAGLCRLRRGVPRFRPGARHAQGVRAERDARQAPAGQGQGALREHHGRARDQYAGPGHHGHGHRGRRGGGPRLGRVSGARGGDGSRRARHRAHAGRRGLPAAARAAHAAAPGHARHLRGAGRLPDPRRRAPGERPPGRRRGGRAAGSNRPSPSRPCAFRIRAGGGRRTTA